MTDKWLAILNDHDDRLICHAPSQCFSLAQLRWRINFLQGIISKTSQRKWVLYERDGFQFIGAMFALLTLGRDVLIPASRNRAVIETLLEPGFGLIGTHKELQNRIDIDTSKEGVAYDFNLNGKVIAFADWGQVAFCTSGSSGRPKVIAKSAEQLYREVENFNLKWQPTPNTLFIPLVTHLHIYGLTFAFLLPLLARASFYLPRNTGLLGAVEPLMLNSKRQINELVVVTSPTIGRQAEHIQVLAESGSVSHQDRVAPVSRVFCAGGKLNQYQGQKIIDLFDCPITEIFGSTETGAVATREHSKKFKLSGQSQASDGSLWQLLAGLKAGVVMDSVKIGAGLRGEFAVWGGHVGGSMDAPVLSGDEAQFFAHDQFELLGRSNQICKIEGKRAPLPHIVEILKECELISDAAILPYEKKDREVLLCGVVLSPQGELSYRSFGKTVTDTSIREHALQLLDPVLVPRNIRYLEKIPRSQMDKLVQQKLIELLVNPIPPALPITESVKINHDELMLSLRIPIDLCFLRGHFENKPLVPGVVLLRWVYHFIGKYWGLSMDTAVVNRLKFYTPATAHDKLMLIVSRVGNNVKFLYQNEQKIKFSSGEIPVKQ